MPSRVFFASHLSSVQPEIRCASPVTCAIGMRVNGVTCWITESAYLITCMCTFDLLLHFFPIPGFPVLSRGARARESARWPPYLYLGVVDRTETVIASFGLRKGSIKYLNRSPYIQGLIRHRRVT